MLFEFDPRKSAANRKKHGIDFVAAQELWRSPVMRLSSRHPGEVRELAIGMIEDRHWTAIIAQRGTAIRLISCRRSRNDEKKLYEEAFHDSAQSGSEV